MAVSQSCAMAVGDIYIYPRREALLFAQKPTPPVIFRIQSKGFFMKYHAFAACLAFSIALLGCSSASDGSKPARLITGNDSLSYVLGLDVGKSIQQLKTEINIAVFARGVDDMIKGTTPMMAEDRAGAIKQAFFAKAQQARMEEAKIQGEKNLKEGETFLAENAKKPGVKTTASGLEYQMITAGTGPSPKPTDKVKVDYVGKLINGKEFESSKKRGQPAVFQLNQVIPAWTEGLQLMKVGGKAKLFVPSKLAYGERGAGQDIGPNATLIFEVELLGIEK